jgi:hypothetical protein
MKDKKPLFGIKAKHLDHLVSHILDQSEGNESKDVSNFPQRDVEHSESWIGSYRLQRLLGEGGIGGEEAKLTLTLIREVSKLHRDQGDYQQAEKILLDAEATARRVYGVDQKPTQLCVFELVQLYETWGRPTDADKWREKLSAPGTQADK